MSERDVVEEVLGKMVALTQGSKTLKPVGAHIMPNPEAVREIIATLREALFFGYLGNQDLPPEHIESHMRDVIGRAFDLLAEQIPRAYRHDCKKEHKPCDKCRGRGRLQARALIEKLPRLRELLEADVQAAYDGDPAAKNNDEIVFSYPGLFAITVHRVAHALFEQGVPILPRLLSEAAHGETGVDIHPGATIGRSFFIDHGTGVVIGETTIIGDRVKMYQGATLGALSFPSDARGKLIRGTKRHPTIEDDVTIYAGATILGGDTVIGRGSVIGGSVWLTRSVPPGTKVVIESPRLKYKNSERAEPREYVPDFQI